MVSVGCEQEKHNARVSLIMMIIGGLFVAYMVASLVEATRVFWASCTIQDLLP